MSGKKFTHAPLNGMVMSSKAIAVEAPATAANLGPGFDVVAISLEKPRDRLVAEEASSGISLTISGAYADRVPHQVEHNSAGVVARRMAADFGLGGIKINLVKGVRPGSGLGSSSASAAACAFAINELFDLKLSKLELVRYASYGELASAGVVHADNVAAAIFGGFVIVSYEPLRVVRFDPPEALAFAIAIPEIKLTTREARAVLPKQLTIEGLVSNVSGVSLLVAGFASGNVEMIGAAAMMDSVVEPARARLIEGFGDVRKAALDSGASGVAISGAGPSLVAIVNEQKVDPNYVGRAMQEAFSEAGIKAEVLVTKPGPGVRQVR